MPYAPQRRHAVGVISSTTQALNLIEHLYQPNLLILVSRMLAQMQIAAAGLVHPNRSLLSLCLMLTLMNGTAMLLHLLDYTGSMSKGVMLDFVGQTSLSRMLLLDLTIYILQIHTISISYLNNKAAGSSPSVPELPYADMLLPVSDVPEEVSQEDFDIESGLRRRKGKAQAEEDEEEVVWLDDDGGEALDIRPSERDRLLNQATPPRLRAREPPRIASISLSHLINLLIHLPTPSPPSTIIAGSTPAVSPGVVDSQPNTGSTDPMGTIYTMTDEEEDEGRSQEEEAERRRIVRDQERGEGQAEGLNGESGQRMPGDYWVRGRGNGG